MGKKIGVSGIMVAVMTMFTMFFFMPAAAEAQATPAAKTPHRVPALAGKIKLDGVLNEAAWATALKLELNYEVRPGENITPPVKTDVLLVYSTSYLYVAFRAYDPNPASVRARIRERDNFAGDDWVGISLDTFNDQRRSYSFLCNALGVQADEIADNEGGGESWDAIWNSAGRINGEGYVVEMAIPFSSLSFQRKKDGMEQIWGIDAVRSYPRSLRYMISLFPWDRSNNCYMCQASQLIGFAGATPGRNIELDPTLSSIFTQERDGFPDGKFTEKEKKVDPGLSARWGITPNLTLNAAVNPDFSNVEADIPQLDINTRFALYYPEKRPFFLEGAGIFTSRFQAINTRALADPDWGVKLTGKQGKHTIGFFSVQDSITNFLLPGRQASQSRSLAVSNVGSVLRYRHDVGKSSTLGLVVTDREGEGYFNRMVGVDGDLRVTPKDRIRFQLLGSQTRDPEGISGKSENDTMRGAALDVYYLHDTRSLDWYLGYTDVGEGFRADLGFMPQTGYRNYTGGAAYSWNRPRGHWFTVLNVGSGYKLEKDYDNNLLAKAVTFDFNYIGPAQSYFNLTANVGKQSYGGFEFNDNYVYFNGAVRPSGTLEFFFNGLVGDGIDYDDIRLGKRLQLGGTVRLNLRRHLECLLNQQFERLSAEPGRLYTANISYLRFVYHFNRRIFLRATLKYVDYHYNPEHYVSAVEPLFRHLFSQVLLSYELNPRTVLFMGYSDNSYGYENIRLTQSNRTVFIKLGYALVL